MALDLFARHGCTGFLANAERKGRSGRLLSPSQVNALRPKWGRTRFRR
jgi:hypothetical protein